MATDADKDTTASPSVLLLVPTGFEFLEFAAVQDVMGWSFKVEVVTAGDTTDGRDTVKCAFRSAELRPSIWLEGGEDEARALARQHTAVAIPGGFPQFGFTEAAQSPTFVGVLQAFAAEGKVVASICGGAIALARAGLLEGRVATTYHLPGKDTSEYLRLLTEHGARVRPDALMVVSDKLITSRGPKSAIPVAFHLLSTLVDKEVYEQTRLRMGFSEQEGVIVDPSVECAVASLSESKKA